MAQANTIKSAEFESIIGGDESIIGDMYSQWTLDCVVELAYGVSNDFVSRPHLYQNGEIPDEIVDLRMSYGTSRYFPNMQQRQVLHLPIFGKSDGQRPDGSSSPFHLARKKLIDASIAYAERVYDTGLAMLKERIRSALIPLRSHLQSVAGRSVDASYNQSRRIFHLAVSILTSSDVARVFGIEQAEEGWPLDNDDPNGAKLVGAIGATLKLPPEYVLTYDKFILLQRVAREGREALKLVLLTAPAPDQDVENLVTKVYTWGTSLRDFQS
jgi:hypothetical protein